MSRGLGAALGYDGAELATRCLLDWIHPDDRATLASLVTAGTGSTEARHASRGGEWLSIHWTVRTERGEVYVIGRPADTVRAVPSCVGFASTNETAMNRMLSGMALIVEAKNPGKRCSILLVDRERNCVTVGAGPSLPAEYNAAVEGLKIGPMVGSCGTAAYWNVPVVVEDIARDPLWSDLRYAAEIAGVAACWSHPVRATNGEVLGAMALYDAEPSAPEQYQMDGLEIAAHMVGLAVEREQLQFQLQQAAKLEALGVLAGGVAHDFNNLLGVVLGNAELAISSLPPHSSVTEMLEDIAEAADSATGLCNQMLAFAGRNAVSAEPVECNAMIRDLSKLMQVSLSKKAALRLELAGNLGVTADRSQLRQVFMNLITNAAESIGNFEGEVVVKTEALRLTAEDITNRRLPERFQPGEFVEVSVRDSGCGMDAATRARVFDPFFTTKLDGRGLGLAAVKGIADAHGWMLQVNSSPGTGSTFTLLMPRADVPYTCGDEGHRDDGAEVVARVLVVDDEPGVLSIVTKFLERAGMDVLQATNGVEAIEIFRDLHDSIDCVVLDLNMPKLDGEEVFRELKAIREDVPVLLSSGFAEQEVLDRFRGAGLFGVVQKPVRMATLLEKVKLAVRRG